MKRIYLLLIVGALIAGTLAACAPHPDPYVRRGRRSGAVIGGDGFGYELVDGRHRKIEQTGIVQIDDDVEIGACNTIIGYHQIKDQGFNRSTYIRGDKGSER